MTLQLWQRWQSELLNGESAEVPHYEAKHSGDLSEPAWMHTHLNKRTSTHIHAHPKPPTLTLMPTSIPAYRLNDTALNHVPASPLVIHEKLTCGTHFYLPIIISSDKWSFHVVVITMPLVAVPTKVEKQHYFLILLILLWHNVFTSSYIQ